MRLFYGWVIVSVGIIVTCIGMGSMMSLGVYLQPIAQDMGWTRAGISFTAVLAFLAMGFGSFLWGALSDRFGTRVVVLAGGVILGIGLISASRAATLWQFQVLFGLLVGLAAGSFYAPLTASVTRWFTANRSLAVALVSAGMGLGSLLVAPLSRWIITNYDWRTAMLTLGALAFALIVPAALFIRHPPVAALTAAAADRGADGRDFTMSQVIRTPQFAAISLTFFCCCAAHSGPIFHMVSYAIDCGIPAMTAATVFGTTGLASLSGRIVCGLIADRVGAKQTLVAGLAVQAIAVSLYIVTRGTVGFYALAALFGLAFGGVMPLYAILVREYFGAKVMGSAFGAAAMISTLGMALGPWAGGWLFDTFGGYFWMYIGSFGIGLGAVAIAFTFRPPQRQPVVSAVPA
ncbi:MAG TPA: MFS transporter [Acetobacteraceae bacterium]